MTVSKSISIKGKEGGLGKMVTVRWEVELAWVSEVGNLRLVEDKEEINLDEDDDAFKNVLEGDDDEDDDDNGDENGSNSFLDIDIDSEK